MIKVFYSDKLTVDDVEQGLDPRIIKSPSAMKPRLVAEAVKDLEGIELVDPTPIDREDFKLAHSPAYVDGIFDMKVENGFGNISFTACEILPYTTGAMFDAASQTTVDQPCAALVSGFHHAGYLGWRGLGYFCTFNGLVVAAKKLGGLTMIIDADMHFGNGTESCLKAIEKKEKFSGLPPILHYTFGKFFSTPKHADDYLAQLEIGGPLHSVLKECKVERIIYQAGADVHVDDPYGGVLTSDQIYERDFRMFSIAKDLGIPIAWNLAGGYQSPVQKVIDIHLLTFKACKAVYG